MRMAESDRMVIMTPSAEYLVAPDVSRSREQACAGLWHVVLENYATSAKPGGISTVYLSADGGDTFASVDWPVSAIGRIKLAVAGRHWPPDECRLGRVSDDGVEVMYLDHLDASNAKVFTATYSFETRQWQV